MNINKIFSIHLAITALLALGLITGCSAQTTAPPATEVEVLVQPTATIANTNTPVPPTETPAPTLTPTATFTPTPTNTPLPTATPTLSNIQLDNVDALKLQARYGIGTVQGIRFSPDGEEFVVLTTASLQLYDTKTAKLIWYQDTPSIYSQIAFSEDGEKIITATEGGATQEFDAKTGEPTSILLEATANNGATSLSECGGQLASASHDNYVTIYDTATGEKLMNNVGVGKVSSLKINSDGSELVTLGESVQVWNVADGEKTGSYAWPNDYHLINHGFEYSPDGTKFGLLTLGNRSGYSTSRIYIWEVGTNKPIQNYQFDKLMLEFVFSADGKEILVGNRDGGADAYDIQSMKKLRSYTNLNYDVTHIAVSADGKWIATASIDGMMSVQDYGKIGEANSIDLGLSKTDYGTIGAALAPDGQTIAIPAPDTQSVRIVNLSTGETEKRLGAGSKGYYGVVAYSSNGKVAAARDDYNIAVWNVESGVQSLLIETGYTRRITVLKFSPDGKYLASLSHIALIVWDVETGEKIQTFYGYLTLDFSPDGRYIASDNIDYGLYVWNVETGKQVVSITSEYIYDVAYAPDGQTIAIACWDMKAPDDSMNLVYFVDPNKKYQNTAMELVDHLNRPYFVAYSPDGSLLATGDAHGNVYVWDTATGNQLMKIPEVTDLADLFFTPDHLALVVVGADGVIYVYGVR